jgi:hypothetical protein
MNQIDCLSYRGLERIQLPSPSVGAGPLFLCLYYGQDCLGCIHHQPRDGACYPMSRFLLLPLRTGTAIMSFDWTRPCHLLLSSIIMKNLDHLEQSYSSLLLMCMVFVIILEMDTAQTHLFEIFRFILFFFHVGHLRSIMPQPQ